MHFLLVKGAPQSLKVVKPEVHIKTTNPISLLRLEAIDTRQLKQLYCKEGATITVKLKIF